MLFVITMVSVGLLMAINSVIGQQYPPAGQGTEGGYAILGGISLGPGTNTIALSVSIASQQGSQIYFQVNGFAIVDQQSQAATVYTLSQAMPGIMDTGNNNVQVDVSKLQSSIQSTQQASMSDLYTILRPSVNSLMVLAQLAQQGAQGAQATFQVQSLQVIMPDGQANVFNLSQPMSVVVDSSAMRVYTVGFPQVYNLVNTFIMNIQNNYYTSINYNVVAGPTIVVTPPVVYPIIAPIAFPAVWPVFYPVPVPVPMPVVTVTPLPPSVTPTKMPTVSPAVSPTKMPTVSPAVSPTKMPTVSPTVTHAASLTPSPTKKPVLSAIATKKPISSAIVPTKKPVSTYKPITTFKPTAGGGGGVITTKKPITTTYRPGGGGMPIATRMPITTKKP
ncbi:hypothetical protein [Methanocella conradii]|uniref:hypothetical protein n=1 Tax=Methanocella conradii TaxID=1175444 RepID=UPI0024B33394|nr:hypothetical protein [Methanocella conradii]MDI6897253.1 hypothetical protein [Methanocella conradii]